MGEISNPKLRRAVMAVGIVACLIVGALWSTGIFAPGVLEGNRISRGVTVGGHDVGGMTVSEARMLLQTQMSKCETAPISLRLGGETWRVSPEEIGTVVDVEPALKAAYSIGRSGRLYARLAQRRQARREGVDIPLVVSVDEQRLRDLVFALASVVQVQPVDARIVITDGDEVIIEPSSEGRRLNVDELISRLRSTTLERGAREIDIPVETAPPAVVTSELESRGIARLLGEYTTKFKASNVKRSENIRLGAAMIDGTIVAPGDVFSFNEVVGPRTPERGFLEADIILNAELVPGIGGGICQVSTTLYNAALLSDLEIMSRINHSLPISYVPLGRDATVSYGAIDLKIRNNTGHHVLLKARVDKDTITFKIYGDLPRDMIVGIETQVLEKIEPGVIEQVDAKSPPGSRTTIQTGAPGYLVAVWRVVKSEGVEIRRELISRDRYKPQPVIVKAGPSPQAVDTP
ncbi:MAG TPA: VanW family protein [Bacillota bacterium]|nr:VanW family protein [Bacillota bacterium]